MRGVIGLVIVVVIVAIVWWRGRGTDDTVESMKIDYRITTDGIVHVRETIVYRFGSRSGRHGIYRNLIVRKHSGHPGKDVQYWSASAARPGGTCEPPAAAPVPSPRPARRRGPWMCCQAAYCWGIHDPRGHGAHRQRTAATTTIRSSTASAEGMIQRR